MLHNILLTGLTSFSGCYIARALALANFNIITPLSSGSYEGLKADRLKLVAGQTQIIQPINICSSEFIEKVSQLKPNIFINHGAYVQNYRSPDFDVLKHLETNLKYIKPLIENLKKNDCQLFIHSGSAFEPEEGYTEYGLSAYGVAKKMVWDLILFWCTQYKLPVIKIIIPNPYGHLENEDRLLPIFYHKIKAKQEVKLTGSQAIRNNIRGEKLAEYYLQACKLAETNLPEDFVFKISPIGYIESQKQFVLRALQESPYNLTLSEMEKYISFD